MEEKKSKLEFTVEETDSGLVFERNVEKFPRNAPANRTPVENFEQKKQFDVPTRFTVSEKYDKGAATVEEKYNVSEKSTTPAPSAAVQTPAPKAQTTYIPRFTEVSETYRLADKRKDAPKVSKPDILTVETSVADDIDPTAELDEEQVADATVVTVGAPAPETFEIQSTVFKFEDKSFNNSLKSTRSSAT